MKTTAWILLTDEYLTKDSSHTPTRLLAYDKNFSSGRCFNQLISTYGGAYDQQILDHNFHSFDLSRWPTLNLKIGLQSAGLVTVVTVVNFTLHFLSIN